MVIFTKKSETDGIVEYEYFPEGNTEADCGIIVLNTKENDIYIKVVAEKDFLRHASASEINQLRDAIDEMRKERGEQPLTEEELPPATKDEEWYWYADHAMRKIVKAYEDGCVLEKGSVMWY